MKGVGFVKDAGPHQKSHTKRLKPGTLPAALLPAIVFLKPDIVILLALYQALGGLKMPVFYKPLVFIIWKKG